MCLNVFDCNVCVWLIVTCVFYCNSVLQEGNHYEQASDVRLQLKFFEQLDQMEKQRKEEQEREILMKAAKVRQRSIR